MEVTISKQVDEIIKIETPKFFKSKYTHRLAKLTETGLTKVSDDLICYSEYRPTCTYFQKEIVTLLEEFTEVSKLEFEEKLSTTLVKLQVVGYE